MKNKKLVRVEKGYGPRHAMNAQEGAEAVPSPLPDVPEAPPDRGTRAMRALFDQVIDPETRAEIARNPTGAKALATYASLGIMLMPEHGGQRLGEMGKSAVPAETWLSFKKVKGSEIGQVHGDVRVDPAGNHFELVGSHLTDDGTWHGIVKQVEAPGTEMPPELLDKTQPLPPSEPPYDALKEPPPNKPFADNPRLQDEYEKWLKDNPPPEEEPPSEDKASQELPAFRQKWIMRDWLRRNPGPPIPPDQTQFGPKFEPPPDDEPPFEPNVPRYGKGAKRVQVHKGYGPRHAENSKEGDTVQAVQGNTDTVPAMLTPREAVLNRNAAELAGRGNIEQLNQEGNQLAKKGVDLAAGGESDVGLSEILKTYQAGGDLTPAEIARVIAVLRGGTGGEKEPSVATEVPKYGEYHEEAPELQNPNRAKGQTSVAPVKLPKAAGAVTDNLLKYVLPGAIRREATAGIPKGVAKGTSDMKSKPKQSKPSGYAGGSPYAQGYQKLQGGGDVPFKPAGSVQSQDINPNLLAGQDLKQGQLNYWNRYGQLPPGLGGGPPPEAPFTGGTPQLPPGLGGGPPPEALGTGGTPRLGGGQPTGLGGGQPSGGWNPTQFDPQLQAYGNLNQAGKKAWNPGGGGFYPQGMGFASGTSAVPSGIGAPNPQTAYSKDPVDFKAGGDVLKFVSDIQQEAQKRGISQSQMAEIAKQFSGLGGGGNANAPGTGTLITDSGMAYPTTGGGYQGGISDIGYPPFLMPNAEYHADKGSTWEGPYDPNYLVQRYAGGTSQVPGYQRGGDIDWNDINSKWEGAPGDLGFNTGLTGFGRPSTMAWAGSNTRALDPTGGRFGFGGFGNMPPAGTPGFLQGPTLHPTTFDPQGYPYPQPVNTDTNLVGRTRGIPRKTTS